MSRTIRLGVAAGLALAASTAWAAAGRSNEKAPGGDVWYDEFYASTPPAPAPVAAAASRGPRASAAAGQHPHRIVRGDARAPARGDHRRLARSH